MSKSDATTDPFEPWCCELKCDGANGSGVLVEIPELNLPTTTEESLVERFPGLYKVAERVCSATNSTNFVLIVAHHTIPGYASIAGWTVHFASGKKVRLDSAVTGAVSCCGADSIVIACGQPDSQARGVLKEHPGKYCELKLDFTVFFLNANIKSAINSLLKRVPHPPRITPLSLTTNYTTLKKILQMHTDRDVSAASRRNVSSGDQSLYSPPPHALHANGTADASVFLYHRQEKEGSVVRIPVTIEGCRSTLLPTAPDGESLRKHVVFHEKLQKLCYSTSNESISPGFSGSPIVYSDTPEPQLLGIHIGENKEEEGFGKARSYTAVSIYGILQLMRGEVVACFSFMRYAQPRRLMPSLWSSLFHGYLTRQKDSTLSLGYLLDFLYLLLEEYKGTPLIAPRVTDSREDKVAALHLLSALFKHFESYGRTQITKAIEDKAVLAGDNTQQAFKDNTKTLCKGMLDILANVESDRDLWEEETVVKACFQCWNLMLNFRYEDIVVSIFTSGNSLAQLGCLQEKYLDCLEIQRDFGQVHKKCRLFLESRHKEQMSTQANEYEERLVNQEATIQSLQGEIQQRQQEIELLEQQRVGAEASCNRKEENIQHLETENRRMSQQLESLQSTNHGLNETTKQLEDNIQTLHTEMAVLKCDKNKAEAVSQQSHQKVATLRTRNEQLEQELDQATKELGSEREMAEYRNTQQTGSVARLTEENRQLSQRTQSLSQQLEREKRESEAAKTEIETLKKQLEDMAHQIQQSGN